MKKILFFLNVALFCSLRIFAQQAPVIKVNGSAAGPNRFENHVGGPICINFYAESPDPSNTDSIELYWNNGLNGATFTLLSYVKQNEERIFCWNLPDTIPLCADWYFTVHARYKNKPSLPTAVRAISIKASKPFTANLHFPQTGHQTYQLVPQTYRYPQGVCSPHDTDVINYQWTVSNHPNGIFNLTNASIYNSKISEHTFQQGGKYVVRLRMQSDEYCCVDFRFDTINVATTTGKKETGEAVFSLYPNPAKNLLHLQTTAEVQHLEMYDVIGRKVHINYTPNGDEYHIELPELSKGMYFIHLITAQQQRFSQKVCIE